jgi:hypothetical protein
MLIDFQTTMIKKILNHLYNQNFHPINFEREKWVEIMMEK